MANAHIYVIAMRMSTEEVSLVGEGVFSREWPSLPEPDTVHGHLQPSIALGEVSSWVVYLGKNSGRSLARCPSNVNCRLQWGYFHC